MNNNKANNKLVSTMFYNLLLSIKNISYAFKYIFNYYRFGLNGFVQTKRKRIKYCTLFFQT